MADYIKRSDVLGIVSARLKPCNALIGDLCNACEDVYRMVELIPSADVMPREDYERVCRTLNKIAEVLRDG